MVDEPEYQRDTSEEEENRVRGAHCIDNEGSNNYTYRAPEPVHECSRRDQIGRYDFRDVQPDGWANSDSITDHEYHYEYQCYIDSRSPACYRQYQE